MAAYNVKCLDASYDQDNEFIVLNCFFEALNERRIVCLHKQDFNYKGNAVPDIEMIKTAKLFRGKHFKLDIQDDPKREVVSPEKYEDFVSDFRQKIRVELEATKEGLEDDAKQIQRKLGRMAKAGKLDAAALMREEQRVQSKLEGESNVQSQNPNSR